MIKSSKPGQLRVNEQIDAEKVRFVTDSGEQSVISLAIALEQARAIGLDLVEVAGNSEPPVCRAMDYGKHIFAQSKSKAASKKKQKKTQVKEIKLRPVTEEGDYQVKLRNLIRFLTAGDKTKVTLRFRGREMTHKEIGMKMMTRIQQDLEEHGVVEQEPKLEGRQIIMVLAPKKGKH